MLKDESTPKFVVEDGDWRLYTLHDTGYPDIYRAYHKHDDGWVSQLTLFAVCARCRAEAPEAFKGFESLIEWER